MNVEGWLIGRRGQALAVAIGLFGLAIVWFGVLAPVWSFFDDRGVLLTQRQDLLIHMRDLTVTLPALRAASAARNQEDGGDPETIMLAGESDAIAAANLEQRVQKMAADAGANLTAVETLPPQQATSRWHKVTLRITLSASWPVLMTLVHSVEQSPTRIMIDDVRFRSPITADRPRVVPIQASMVLYGFRPAADRPPSGAS